MTRESLWIAGGRNKKLASLSRIGKNFRETEKSKTMKPNNEPMTIGSCFSGIGGELVAAAMMGWRTQFFCEINPFGRRVLGYWFPEAKAYEDITKTDFREWRGRVDVLTGGFPCQPFSYAGRRRGADDDRYLWPSMFRAIDEVRPRWFVCENVAGITTMVEQGEVSAMAGETALFAEVDSVRRYRHRETFTLERICQDIEQHGYAVQPVLIPAASVGAPHRRDRVFIIGHRESATADTTVARSESVRRERKDKVHETGYATYTDSHRGRQVHEHLQPGLADGQVTFGNGRKWTSADTTEQHRERNGLEQSETCGAQQVESGRSGCKDGGVAGLGRWDTFPTVSPVHRGNDGLPFPLDSLAIPASRWRRESLKAYGNAIVPQVMYEIFRAIALADEQIL